MAGSLPDVTSRRLPLHVDGTRWFWRIKDDDYSQWSELPNQDLKDLQDPVTDWYTSNTANVRHYEWMLLFPAARNIDKIMLVWHYYQQWTDRPGWNPHDYVYTSTDTTNGYDGTWVQRDVTSTYTFQSGDSAWMRYNTRTQPVTVDWNDVRGLRFSFYKHTNGSNWLRFYALHLYGEYTATANPDRIEFWHPTSDETMPPAHLDWGDVYQGATEMKYVRIKNLSAAMTASGIQLTAPGLSEVQISDALEFSMSSGGPFSNMLEVGNLAPGELSDPIVIKYEVPPNESLIPSLSMISAVPRDWV